MIENQDSKSSKKHSITNPIVDIVWHFPKNKTKHKSQSHALSGAETTNNRRYRGARFYWRKVRMLRGRCHRWDGRPRRHRHGAAQAHWSRVLCIGNGHHHSPLSLTIETGALGRDRTRCRCRKSFYWSFTGFRVLVCSNEGFFGKSFKIIPKKIQIHCHMANNM